MAIIKLRDRRWRNPDGTPHRSFYPMGELGRPTRNFPLILTKDAALDRVAHILSENPDIDAYVKE